MDERWFLVFGFFLLIIIYVDGAACGNAVLEEGEFCDIGKMNGGNCTNFNYTGGSLLCSDDCSEYDFNQCEGEEVCGNGIDEDCNGIDLAGNTPADSNCDGCVSDIGEWGNAVINWKAQTGGITDDNWGIIVPKWKNQEGC